MRINVHLVNLDTSMNARVNIKNGATPVTITECQSSYNDIGLAFKDKLQLHD
jgi:hypothetical protein